MDFLIASKDCEIENCSTLPLAALFLLTPAVSIKVISPSLTGTSIESLVVPDSEETKTLSNPDNLFNKVDLPTFGLPNKETTRLFLFSRFGSDLGEISSRAFFTLSKPWLCAAEIMTLSSNPS